MYNKIDLIMQTLFTCMQGGYDYDFVDFESHRSRFECPICLLCQRDPHQTSCGHRSVLALKGFDSLRKLSYSSP